jgi:hypothetical protein
MFQKYRTARDRFENEVRVMEREVQASRELFEASTAVVDAEMMFMDSDDVMSWTAEILPEKLAELKARKEAFEEKAAVLQLKAEENIKASSDVEFATGSRDRMVKTLSAIHRVYESSIQELENFIEHSN